MAMCITGDERYKYFPYGDKYYYNGTKVVLSNHFINNYTYKGQKIWKYAWFGHRFVVDGRNLYFFSRDNTDWYFLIQNNISQEYINQTCPYFVIEEELLDSAIECFVKPIEITPEPIVEKKDWQSDKVMRGWFTYALALIGSLIFKEFYVIWVIATIVFFSYRKEQLRQ